MLLYLLSVVGVAAALGLNDVSTAQLGQAAAFVVSVVFLYLAWGTLMQKRQAAHPLSADQSLWLAGFVKVYRTSIHIYHNYSALMWCYISIACGGAAIQSLGTIMITYLTDTLNFSSTENGIAILVLLLGSIPGAYLASLATSLLNPVSSLLLNCTLLVANTITAAIILKGPGQQIETYILAFGWGIGTGWKWTTEPLLASAIIPEGQDAELMGTLCLCVLYFALGCRHRYKCAHIHRMLSHAASHPLQTLFLPEQESIFSLVRF
jgi:Na+/melibiose symporter-like transporter